MRKLLCLILSILFVFSVSGCEKGPTIVGEWEAEVEFSVLGLTDQQGTHSAILRFRFFENGTGVQELLPEQMPERNVTESFSYVVDGNNLVLYVATPSGETSTRQHTIEKLTNDSLELSSRGVIYTLRRTG